MPRNTTDFVKPGDIQEFRLLSLHMLNMGWNEISYPGPGESPISRKYKIE